MNAFDTELRLRVGHLFIECCAAETQRDAALASVKAQAGEIEQLKAEVKKLTPPDAVQPEG
jgi:hypothetical protein